MLKIDRSCSQRIITTALQHQSDPLLGLLEADGHRFTLFPDRASLTEALARQPGLIVVHNQHPEALSSINLMNLSASQVVIEIREETRGVLGLQATRHGDHAHIPMVW